MKYNCNLFYGKARNIAQGMKQNFEFDRPAHDRNRKEKSSRICARYGDRVGGGGT